MFIKFFKMSIQTVLESWKDYIDPIEFEALTDFLVRAENGEKMNKILLLEGNGSTGKSSFLTDITKQHFEHQSINIDLNNKLITNIDDYNGKPTPELSHIINSECSLVIIQDHLCGSDIDNKLRLLAEDCDFVHRTPYGFPHKFGKIKGNFVIVTQLGQLSPSLNDILVRVKFTHRFN